VTGPDAGCELCEAARITEWFLEHMLAQLGRVADQQLGNGVWSFDRVMRQIPDHFHAHARDPDWWFRRFSRR
jgi:hypothetical protein